MKLSAIFFGATMAAEPIDYLNTLKEAAHDILQSDDISPPSNKWVSIWERKFERTTARMEYHFGRRSCGAFQASTAPLSADFEYDATNPCAGMTKVLTELNDWSDRHLALCKGQLNHGHHEKRFEKWQKLMNSALNCPESVDPFVAAVEALNGQVSIITP